MLLFALSLMLDLLQKSQVTSESNCILGRKVHFASHVGFAQSSIDVATKLVERRLYSESNDVFGIVLFGTQRTANNMGYSNISISE